MEERITRKDQLNLLLQHGRPISFRFDFPTLTSAQNERWQRHIRSNYKVCGCEMSAIFIAVSLVVNSFCIAFNWFELGTPLRMSLLINSFGIVVIAGIIGKLLGIGLGKRRLKNKLKELTALID